MGCCLIVRLRMQLPLLIGATVAVIACAVIAWTVYGAIRENESNIRNADASLTWPSVKGRVTETRLDASRKPKAKTTDYTALITYTYSVNGQSYTANRIRFGAEGENTRESQQSVLNRFPEGARVDVLYDPANPAIATLLTGRAAYQQAGSYFGYTIIGLCFVGIVAAIYKFWSMQSE